MDKFKKLKFIGLELENHPLFDKKIKFFVDNDQSFDNNETNKIIMLTGKNSTGKTVLLKLIVGTLSLLLKNKSISDTKLNDILFGDNAIKINTFFSDDNFIYKDELILEKDDNKKWIITSEKIYNNEEIVYDRKNLDEVAASVLADDKSIFKILIKTHNYKIQNVIDALTFNDMKNTPFYLSEDQNVPTEILEFLDPTIDYLKIKNVEVNYKLVTFHKLKLKHHDEEFTDADFDMIKKYLSLGTVKGILLYENILYALKTGGVVVIDDFENYLDHEVVKTFVEYFTDDGINKNNATIIFSTHYPKLLNDFECKHKVYRTVKENDNIRLQYFYNNERSFNGLIENKIFDLASFNKTPREYAVYLRLKELTKKVVQDDE